MKSAGLRNLVNKTQQTLKPLGMKSNGKQHAGQLRRHNAAKFESETKDSISKRPENIAPLRLLLQQREVECKQEREKERIVAKAATKVTPAGSDPLNKNVDLLTQIMKMHRRNRTITGVKPSVDSNDVRFRRKILQTLAKPMSPTIKVNMPLSLRRQNSKSSSSSVSSASFGRRKKQRRSARMQHYMHQYGTQNADVSLRESTNEFTPAVANVMNHRRQHLGSQIGRISQDMEATRGIQLELMEVDSDLKERISMAKLRLAHVEKEVGSKPNIELEPIEAKKPTKHLRLPPRYDPFSLPRDSEVSLACEELKAQRRKLKMSKLNSNLPKMTQSTPAESVEKPPKKPKKYVTAKLHDLLQAEQPSQIKLAATRPNAVLDLELTRFRDKQLTQNLKVKQMQQKQQKWQADYELMKKGKNNNDGEESQSSEESLPKGRLFSDLESFSSQASQSVGASSQLESEEFMQEESHQNAACATPSPLTMCVRNNLANIPADKRHRYIFDKDYD